MRKMVKKILNILSCAFLFGVVACSDNTAGVTEDENPGLAFEEKKPVSYDLWAVDNGLQNGKNVGYWFSLGDSDGSSHATITFPEPLDDGMSDSSMKNIADVCGGICGTIEFAESSKLMMSAGIGYALDKDDLTVDALSWNGLCVTYESEFDMRLKFSFDKDVFVDDDMPFVVFPKTALVNTRCAKWENFRPAYSNNVKVEDIAKKLGAIIFEFVGRSKQKGTFNIKGLGSYKASQSRQSGESKKLNSSSSFLSSSAVSEECSFESIDDLWYGPQGSPQVQTGLGNGRETEGFWYDLNDKYESGKIYWPVPQGNEYDPVAVDPIVTFCGGICALMEMAVYGYAGVGFNIVSDNHEFENEAGDVSDWGGLCVTYASVSDIDVVMLDSTDESYDKEVLFMPKFTLPFSLDVTTKCAKWSEFVSSAGNAGNPKHLFALHFVTHGESGSLSAFNIKGLGRYKQLSDPECRVPDHYIKNIENYKDSIYGLSSSSQAISSSSDGSNNIDIRVMKSNDNFIDSCLFKSIDDLWFGPDYAYRVDTQLDNESETSGIWYRVGNTPDDEQGTVFSWPAALGNEYNDVAMDSIIDFCAGVCAEIYYKEDAFSGVAFNVVGESSITNNTLVAGDVSSWGGLCVTYAADADMDVVMIDSMENAGPDQILHQPKVTLPKNLNVTTKCMKWNDFVSSTGKTSGNGSCLTSLVFAFYGKGGQFIRFNIMGLGRFSYQGDHECSVRENFVSGS